MSDEPTSGGLGERLAKILAETAFKPGIATPVAALAPNPCGAEWHVIHAGLEIGPLALAEMIEKAAAGEVDADDLVKQTGGLWTKAREVATLQREFVLRESKEKAIRQIGQFHGIWVSRKALVIGSSVLLGLIALAVTWRVFAAMTAAPSLAQRPKPKDGPLGMKFVPLPQATFYMGGGGGKAGKKTEIMEDFEIAIHTVTQGQWQEVMGNNPSWCSRDGLGKGVVKDVNDDDLKHFPVETVSWNDAQEFIKKLNAKEKGKSYQYRLPSEAEWEYACRGGATSVEECSYHFYFAKPTNDLSSNEANFHGDSPFGKADKGPYLGRTTTVGSYAPNKVGLYDMHGNVFQWCEDFWQKGDSARVSRGGGWRYNGTSCQAAYRLRDAPTARFEGLGFRLVRVLH